MESRKNQCLELLLAAFITFSGGLQDAYSYFCRGGVFANAQTGNVVLLCANLVTGDFLETIKYLVPLLFFVLGAVMAKVLCFLLSKRGSASWKGTVLLLETAALIGAAFVPKNMSLYANALVSFSCAMQVLTFNEVLGNEFASTMCIGNLVKMSGAFVSAIAHKDKGAFLRAGIYLSIILIFGIGAGVGYLSQRRLGDFAILVSAALTLVSSSLLLIERMEGGKKGMDGGMGYENE